MANALYKSPDVPRFDSYPAPPSPGPFLASDAEAGSYPPENPRLNSAAESIGTFLGHAAITLREVPARLGVPHGLRVARSASEAVAAKAETLRSVAAETLESVQQRASDILDTTLQRTTETVDAGREQVNAALYAVRERVGEATDASRQWVQETTLDARRKAADTVDRYPVQTLAVICAAGLIAGSGLRVWRSHATRS